MQDEAQLRSTRGLPLPDQSPGPRLYLRCINADDRTIFTLDEVRDAYALVCDEATAREYALFAMIPGLRERVAARRTSDGSL